MIRTILRGIAAACLLAGLAGPALAAPQVLTPGTVLQQQCTSALDPRLVFTGVPTGRLYTFSVVANFKPGSGAAAVGTITLTRSTDGGQTFQPFMAGPITASRLSGSDGIVVNQTDPTFQFRVECALSSGSVTISAYPEINGGQYSAISSLPVMWLQPAQYANSRKQGVISFGHQYGLTYSAAQIEQLFETTFTPLSASDVAAMTTGYASAYFVRTNPNGSHTYDRAYVTLSIPSGARLSKSPTYSTGGWRELVTDQAMVTAIVDGNGNAVPQAYAGVNAPLGSPVVTFVTGQTVTVTAAQYGVYGINFFPTLLENVDKGYLSQPNTDGPNVGTYFPLVPNLSALGL